jgi:hypothetical protein
VVITSIGTGVPPGTVGGFAMTPFANNDGIASFTSISSLATPLGGTLGFSPAVEARRIGDGWSTWSHGYTGDVYALFQGVLTITLPADTDAFYLYAEPNNFSAYNVTVTDQENDSVTQSVQGNAGAFGFGFYGTGGTTISLITVSAVSGAAGFAVGEFGIARSERQPIPEPTPLALLALAALGLAVTRRRKN